MADTAFQTQYRQEFIAGFEVRQSTLRQTVTSEAIIKGNQAVFLVADSGGAQAVTRGVNGYIPGRPDNLNQNTVQLTEWHDRPERTSFNIFASQGDAKRIMQQTSMAVMNRKIDDIIIAELANATQSTGTAATGATILQNVMKAITTLGNNAVQNNGDMYAVVTPAFMAHLMGLPQFTSADWVSRKPYESNVVGYNEGQGWYEWLGVKWMTNNQLPGLGTNAEQCFLYNKAAIGHAVNTAGIDTYVGYDGREDLSYVRTTYFMGAKLIQNSGVIKIPHDGSDLAAV